MEPGGWAAEVFAPQEVRRVLKRAVGWPAFRPPGSPVPQAARRPQPKVKEVVSIQAAVGLAARLVPTAWGPTVEAAVERRRLPAAACSLPQEVGSLVEPLW